MTQEEMPHPGHDRHLCWLTGLGFQVQQSEEYKDLVRDGKFMCKGCGRVAADGSSLCEPEKL